jgi:hypothetical protein
MFKYVEFVLKFFERTSDRLRAKCKDDTNPNNRGNSSAVNRLKHISYCPNYFPELPGIFETRQILNQRISTMPRF